MEGADLPIANTEGFGAFLSSPCSGNIVPHKIKNFQLKYICLHGPEENCPIKPRLTGSLEYKSNADGNPNVNND
jgi:hypothetical protein